VTPPVVTKGEIECRIHFLSHIEWFVSVCRGKKRDKKKNNKKLWSFTHSATTPAGRASFQPTRYKYLVDWNDFLPAGKVQVPCRLEGSPSSRSVAGPIEGGYPRIPAAADAYPLAGADADVRFGWNRHRISGCAPAISSNFGGPKFELQGFMD
jgi:hypothetical protein